MNIFSFYKNINLQYISTNKTKTFQNKAIL